MVSGLFTLSEDHLAPGELWWPYGLDYSQQPFAFEPRDEVQPGLRVYRQVGHLGILCVDDQIRFYEVTHQGHRRLASLGELSPQYQRPSSSCPPSIRSRAWASDAVETTP